MESLNFNEAGGRFESDVVTMSSSSVVFQLVFETPESRVIYAMKSVDGENWSATENLHRTGRSVTESLYNGKAGMKVKIVVHSRPVSAYIIK